ncbi:MAG: DUF928 domain-containing protein [Scytonematopsis contorta HA4267-MV1]|jgi:hypothetical protein|nr:DUF928 domain-containing protein [Scytonematopsis contorta HA4267-MV1]
MKRRYLVNALGVIALVTSSVSAYAVTFKPPQSAAPRQTTGGASRGRLITPAQGNNTPSQPSRGTSRSNIFTPATQNTTPIRTTGGASRSNLPTAADAATLIAVLPQSYYGTTVSERPTIMVHIPASNAKESVFSIKDEAGKMHYSMTIPVAEKSGVIAIKLPSSAPPLTVGKNYQWFLALKTDGKLSPSTPYVDGWIQRIQPNTEVATAMQQQDALKRVAAFGKHGVWYDCVATLFTLHIEQPNNPIIIKQWQELLASVSLKEIATAPLVPIN